MSAVVATTDGTSSHTVDSAASAIESLLSPSGEDTQSSEALPAKPPKKATAPESEEVPNGADEDEESEEDVAADDDSEGEEDEESEDTPEPKIHRVKVDGEEIEVTEDELHAGYSRQKDYTRKTQALAEERKAFQSEAAYVRAERETYRTQLGTLKAAIESITPQEPNWQQLRQEVPPEEFAASWADWQQHKQRLAQLDAQTQELDAQIAHDRQHQLAQHLQSEHERLLAALPAWKDAEVAKREKTEVLDYAREQGFEDSLLESITDHRVVVLLRKAALYDKAQKARPAVKDALKKVIVAPPTTGAKRASVTDATRAKQRLVKTGRLTDAASAIEHLLG